MPDFNEFSRNTLAELQGLVSQELNDHAQEAIADANDFLRRTQADLNRWLVLLSEGRLTPADLEWLLQGKKDLGKMQALKQAGVSQARINKFQGAVITAAVTAASTGMQMALEQAKIPEIQIPTIPTLGKAKSRSGPPARSARSAKPAKRPAGPAAKKSQAAKKKASGKSPKPGARR